MPTAIGTISFLATISTSIVKTKVAVLTMRAIGTIF